MSFSPVKYYIAGPLFWRRFGIRANVQSNDHFTEAAQSDITSRCPCINLVISATSAAAYSAIYSILLVSWRQSDCLGSSLWEVLSSVVYDVCTFHYKFFCMLIHSVPTFFYNRGSQKERKLDIVCILQSFFSLAFCLLGREGKAEVGFVNIGL